MIFLADTILFQCINFRFHWAGGSLTLYFKDRFIDGVKSELRVDSELYYSLDSAYYTNPVYTTTVVLWLILNLRQSIDSEDSSK